MVDHLFRHQSGKMIAVLTRLFGLNNLQIAEDVVQEAFLKAMQTWKFGQLPNNPSAWLMQVAKNKAIDIFRKRNREFQFAIDDTTAESFGAQPLIEEFFHQQEIEDSQLRMIFTCCHPLLKQDDRLALTLKTVSGFNALEISKALLTNEETIQKRLFRAKEFIKDKRIQFEIPAGIELEVRLETVLAVLYLLFNEGYNSGKADELIRKDVCAEAMRLCKLLTEHKVCNKPDSNALMSLMCFHAARFESRLDENKSIILLQEQDRSRWNSDLINVGHYYLNRSTSGQDISVYHIESAIAAEHCMACSFANTNWVRLLQLYDLLFTLKPFPIIQLNRSIVLAEMGRIEEAINIILSIPNLEAQLKNQYIYSAVLGDLYKRLSDQVKAKEYLQKALDLTTSTAEKNLIRNKIETLN